MFEDSSAQVETLSPPPLRSNLNLTHEQAEKLIDNLHPGRVKERTQGGSKLSYLEGYDVKATLIRIFGFGGFSAEVIESEIPYQEQYQSSNDKPLWRVAAKVTVRLSIHDADHVAGGATYTETAIAEQSSPKWGDAADFAIKTAETDALKRAAIYLGTQFGLSLYDNGSLRDVVSVVLAPGQADQVMRIREAREASLAKAKENMDRMLGQQGA